jgi:hypothetical protein
MIGYEGGGGGGRWWWWLDFCPRACWPRSGKAHRITAQEITARAKAVQYDTATIQQVGALVILVMNIRRAANE